MFTLTPAQLDTLRSAFAGLRSTPQASWRARKIVRRAHRKAVEQLAAADINILSAVAQQELAKGKR